jgi:hypothetical protein
MGEMDREEAEHAISNAEQVILFAQAAMKRGRIDVSCKC